VTPIEVSPIGVGAFLSARGLRVLRSEIGWVWLPSALLAAAALAVRRARRPAFRPAR
jgi:inner membrane protein